MNRFRLFFVVISLGVVTTGSLVSAQTTTSSTAPDVTENKVTTPPKRTFTAEPTLPKIAQSRLLNLTANMSNRMDSAVARLQNVTDRLTSRLNKLSEANTDITAARSELALAQTKLNEAKRNLVTIDTEVNAFIGSATPRENWQNLKTTYLGTQAIIIAAHQSILATIKLAQTAIASPVQTATSTTASSTNN